MLEKITQKRINILCNTETFLRQGTRVVLKIMTNSICLAEFGFENKFW